MFDRLKRTSIRIRRIKTYFGKWDCQKGCFDVPNTDQRYIPFRDAKITDEEAMFSDSNSLHRHIYTRYNQRDAYRSAWEHLQTGEVLVAQDFGTLTCNSNAADREHYVTDYCVLLRWKEDNQEKRFFID